MTNPYEIWQAHTLLAVMRDAKAEDWYFQQFFPDDKTVLSEDEYIDLEKLPIEGRKLAPFVLPLGRGDSVYDDSQRTYRFKPAYVIVEEHISPLDGLSVMAGVDPSMLDPRRQLSVIERRRILKAMKAKQAQRAVERRWEWMRAKAIIDGKVTVAYKDGTSVLVDFQRALGHTEVLTGGNCWGESGVSILDHIQAIVDAMNNAEFGGFPLRMTMGSAVMPVVRADTEILDHMDVNIRGASVTIERGVVAGGPNGGKIYKFGELQIGGASGVRLEMWVNNETYTDSSGNQARYLGEKEVVFTGAADAIQGHSCFGRIVDQDAEYRPLPIFPKNFTTGDDVKTEHMSFKSAPLFVPIRPNATYKVTALD